VPGYYTEVHHVTAYAQCHTTNINDLTFACGGHHPLAERGWTTRKRKDGTTEWIPQPTPPQAGGTPTPANPEPTRSTTPKSSWPTTTMNRSGLS